MSVKCSVCVILVAFTQADFVVKIFLKHCSKSCYRAGDECSFKKLSVFDLKMLLFAVWRC